MCSHLIGLYTTELGGAASSLHMRQTACVKLAYASNLSKSSINRSD